MITLFCSRNKCMWNQLCMDLNVQKVHASCTFIAMGGKLQKEKDEKPECHRQASIWYAELNLGHYSDFGCIQTLIIEVLVFPQFCHSWKGRMNRCSFSAWQRVTPIPASQSPSSWVMAPTWRSARTGYKPSTLPRTSLVLVSNLSLSLSSFWMNNVCSGFAV